VEQAVSFLKYLQFEKRYSAKTVLAYRADLEQFDAFLTHDFGCRPEEATYAMVRSWLAHLAGQALHNRSINRKIACLRSFFKFLIKAGVVSKNPMQKIRVLKAAKTLPQFVQEREMAQVLDQMAAATDFAGKRNQLILELLYGTGMRLAELISLQSRHIHLREKTMRVTGKRNKERVIPFTEPLRRLIEEYLTLRRETHPACDIPELLITDQGSPLYPMFVYRVVRQALAGAPSAGKKSPHVLRHTYATHLVNKGAELNAVKDLLGHSSLAATQVYTHNSIEKLKKVYRQAHPKATK
jgi:integrase/recombinase XerC